MVFQVHQAISEDSGTRTIITMPTRIHCVVFLSATSKLHSRSINCGGQRIGEQESALQMQALLLAAVAIATVAVVQHSIRASVPARDKTITSTHFHRSRPLRRLKQPTHLLDSQYRNYGHLGHGTAGCSATQPAPR